MAKQIQSYKLTYNTGLSNLFEIYFASFAHSINEMLLTTTAKGGHVLIVMFGLPDYPPDTLGHCQLTECGTSERMCIMLRGYRCEAIFCTI